ncbi:MAG: Pls/PosA family non-ribosomal peptide synthetase [Rhizobiaceae bacterium]
MLDDLTNALVPAVEDESFDGEFLATSKALVTPMDADNTPRNIDGERFHHLFEDLFAKIKAGKRRNKVALEFETEEVTFAQLDALANQIGRYLINCGVKAGDRVALLLGRTVYSYASVLAVSKIGCAFVPLDASFPDKRVGYICSDSGARFAISEAIYSDKFAEADVSLIVLDELADEYGALPTTPPCPSRDTDKSDALCYIIYTSGTTGNPKGVPINHSSICNFLKVAAAEYGFVAQDRVFQSLTLAFDYSIEEIWVPLLCGARLVPAPCGISILGCDLAEFLIERKITAWCSVPTVLTTIEEDLPDLRLLIVSGEACAVELVERWSSPKRRFLNLYGPTEATVSATWRVMKKGEKVTIGKPLPTYTAMVLSPTELSLMDVGEEGELALAGIGLSDGYLNREKETKKAFVPDFLDLDHNPGGMIYRTGDLARINKHGDIEYLGRVDTQVKIRGYRIELSEIESAAKEITGLNNLIVNPVEIEPGHLELATYFTCPSQDAEVDISALQSALRDRLPPYMVPAYFEKLEAMPLLPSQKVDRKSLPLPTQSRLLDASQEYVKPTNDTEAALASQLADFMKVDRISIEADFFGDLSLNSLSMARFLGTVRKNLGFQQVSMKQIYQNTCIRDLARVLGPMKKKPCARELPESGPLNGSAGAHPGTRNRGKADVHTVPNAQYVAFAVSQIGWMLLIAIATGIAGLSLFNWLLAADGFWDAYVRAVAGSAALFVGMTVFLIALKWIAMGRFRREVIPVWTVRHFRFWIAQTAVQANPLVLFRGTPIYNVYLRLVGARVGKGTLIFSPPPVCTDLISIGENSVIRTKSAFHGYTARNGRLHLGTVKIGSESYLGEASVMDINSELGNDAQLGNRSALHEGQKAEGGKTHYGSPAIVGDTDFIRVPVEDVSPARAWIYTLGQFIYGQLFAGLVAAAFVLLLNYFGGVSGVIGMMKSNQNPIAWTFGLSLAFYFLAIATGVLSVSIFPKLWNYFFRPGEVHKLFSVQYFLSQNITRSSNSSALLALFGDSSLVVPYFKAVGYDLKNMSQNGSNFGVRQTHHSPFLCKFNDNTLVADGLHMINMDVSRTSFKMSQITFPKNLYLGNDLHYPTGAMVGENCLVATKAMLPIDGEMRVGVGVLGSPPFEIPRPQQDDDRLDYYKRDGVLEQHLWLKLKSNLRTLAWFMLRNWSVGFFSLLAGLWMIANYGEYILANVGVGSAVLAVFGWCVFMLRTFYNIAFERIATWYRPIKPRICSLYEQPFWDHERFWKLSFDPIRDAFFSGTPLKNLISRCQGMKVGKQVFDNGCGFSEPALVTIGDYCTLNMGSAAQGHSLEDGMFKADYIKIGDRCTLGTEAFVHYGTDIGNDVDIRTDAFLMKGSVIADGEIWTGNPAQPMEDEQNFIERPCANKRVRELEPVAPFDKAFVIIDDRRKAGVRAELPQ